MRVVVLLMLIYFAINAIRFVNFPANCHIPRASLKARELKSATKDYLKEGDKDNALKVYRYLLDNYPEYIHLNAFPK